MQALIAPIASGVVSALLAAVGVYVAITNRLTRLETLIDSLREETAKHNAVVERTFKLEADSATSWKRYDELTARVERLESKS
jgi:hypothetical protein